MVEAGVPGFTYQSWYGFLTTTGTPANVVSILNREIRAALSDPDVMAKLTALGMEAAPSSPQELRNFMVEDESRWAKVIAIAHIKFD